MVAKSRRLAALPLAILLLFSAMTTCFAAEVEDTSPGSAETQEVTETSTPDTASSDLIPIERSANEIDGEMVIVEVFEVPATLNPQELIKPNFEQDGYLYEEDSIVKTPFSETKEKEVEMEFSDATDTDDMAENVAKLPFSMMYEVDGYVGELYLNPQTIQITATAQKTQSSTKKEVKRYNLEMNDPSQVPQSYNGLPLTNLTWEEAGYIEDSSIPSSYVAVATYSRTSSWKVDSAWELTATYQGTAVYENVNSVRYTVTYKGTEIPNGYVVIDGELAKAPNSALGIVLRILGILLLIALIVGAVLFLMWAMKKGLISSRKITVQAQDDSSGEYTVIQKVRVNKNAPAFSLDTLKAPASRHFLCEMSAKQANVLKGKIINVTADGHIVAKHQVQPVNTTDKYVFSVDLETVDAGPIDTFAL